MNKNIQKNIDYSTVFDSFQYATDYYDFDNGSTMQEMVDVIMCDKDNKFDRNKAQQLQDMLNANPELKEAKLISQSHKDGLGVIHSTGKNATDDYIQACAYKLPGKDGDVYVAYRGTGDGRWGDNGQGFTQQSTDMQRDAQKYFDYVVEKYGLDKSNGNLYVTGHSKGGNEAQYVMMTSKYNDKIDGCYSIDGQGFSKKAIEYFKQHNKDGKYDELLSKMYSINGENDYVHFLINPIIPEENTYYIDQPGSNAHDIFSLYKNGKLGWRYDKDGNLINSEPGPLGRLAEELMDNIRELPEEEQGKCAMALMSILEKVFSGENEGMDGAKAEIDDYASLLQIGLPTIIFSFAEWGIKETAPIEALMFGGIMGGVLYKIVDSYFKEFVDISYDMVVKFYGFVAHTINKIRKMIINTAIDWIVDSYNKIISFINGIKEWIYKLSVGYKYAVSNPYIAINTNTMNSYASQLENLSRRAKNLDSRMNNLYWQAGFDWNGIRAISNLGTLLKAEIVLDFARRLDKNVSYLRETASEFEQVERDICGMMG